MSSLAVLMLVRHSGAAVEAQAQDVAGLLRPGDHVVIVADDANPDTDFRVGRIIEQMGFGPDITVTRIRTGVAGDGDTGIALNLGLQTLSVPGAARTRLLVLGPGSRLDADIVLPLRDRAETEGLDLLTFPLDHWDPDLGRPAPPTAPQPGLDGMLIRWDLIAAAPALRATEGYAGHGALGVWWQVRARAQLRAETAQTAGHTGPRPEPGGSLTEALCDLLDTSPDAVDWVREALPGLLHGLRPGGMAGVLASGPRLAAALSGGQTASDALLDGLAQGSGPAVRAALLAELEPVLPLQSPAAPQNTTLKVHLTGRHSHRTPLAYDALTPLWESALQRTEDPGQADLIVIAHPHNAAELSAEAASAVDAGTPLALISEEPFWDTLFSPDPLAHRVTLGAAHLGAVPVHQVNHHRSPIFDFDRIPYYLLTDPRFVVRYKEIFARNAARSAMDWQAAFAARPLHLAFMAERRPEAFHNVAWPDADLLGLCAWRTELALACTGDGIARIGASWGTGPSRFDLTDWHGEKLAQLDGQARMLSGIENTHQPTYLSEKLFDAFACGSHPLYVASAGHRVHDLGLPEGSWLNLWELSPEDAARAVEGATREEAFFADYVTAQQNLAALFSDTEAHDRERHRLGHAVIDAVQRLVALGPA